MFHKWTYIYIYIYIYIWHHVNSISRTQIEEIVENIMSTNIQVFELTHFFHSLCVMNLLLTCIDIKYEWICTFVVCPQTVNKFVDLHIQMTSRNISNICNLLCVCMRTSKNMWLLMSWSMGKIYSTRNFFKRLIGCLRSYGLVGFLGGFFVFSILKYLLSKWKKYSNIYSN